MIASHAKRAISGDSKSYSAFYHNGILWHVGDWAGSMLVKKCNHVEVASQQEPPDRSVVLGLGWFLVSQVMSMQNLGLLGMMTVEWPSGLAALLSICQLLLLDIDSYGFSCVAGIRALSSLISVFVQLSPAYDIQTLGEVSQKSFATC